MFIYTTFNYIHPSGRDTDDDDDPFAESKDEEEREDNKTLLLATYLYFDGMFCHMPDFIY